MNICTADNAPLPPAVVSMKNKYPSIDEFTETWKPAKLNKWAVEKTEHCMLTPNSPTMGMLDVGYGTKAAAGWLATQLMSMNQILGLSEASRLDGTQCLNLAIGIIKEHPGLKASELWVFLRKWSTGGYGKKKYGSVDPTELGDDIGKYIRERRDAEYRARMKAETKEAEENSANIDVELAEKSALVGSKEWDGMSEERKLSVVAFLRHYGRI